MCLWALGFSFRSICWNFPNWISAALIHSGTGSIIVVDFVGKKSKYSPGCLSTINYFVIFMIWLKNSTVFWLGEGIICVSGLMYLWHWSLSDFIKNRIFLVVLVMPNINVRLEAKHFVYLLSLHSLCGRTILLGLPSSVVVFLLFMLYTNRNYNSCLLLSFAFVNFYVRVLLTL